MNLTNVEFSEKQLEYIRNATHRWNGKIGATRSGKTFLDRIWTIPYRITQRLGKDGLVFICGVSKSTIERNVLEPLRQRYGSQLVGEINSANMVYLFGEWCYALGTEKVSQVSKFRGADVKYLYADEIVEWNKDVFYILQTRLSFPYSCCDYTGNPAGPNHWFKVDFLDRTDIDNYCQSLTLFDNPFLDPSVIDAICKEMKDSIYYDRYVLGKWKRAEGSIYIAFANNPEKFILDEKDLPPLMLVEVGIDFGGNLSKHTFVATGFTRGFRDLIVLDAEKHETECDPNQLNELFTNFCEKIYNKYQRAFDSNFDNAEPTLGRGMANACALKQCRTNVQPAIKRQINSRIACEVRLMGAGRFWVMRNAHNVVVALTDAVWDEKKPDTRLDDGTSDIDTLDALEYSFERHIEDLIDANNQSLVERK